MGRSIALVLALAISGCTTGADVGGTGLFATSVTSTATTPMGESSGDPGDTSQGDGEVDSGEAATGADSGEVTGNGTGAPGSCGDGSVNGAEACDGMDLGGQTCAEYGYEAGVLSCGPECQVITDACSTCGDGEIALTEACDGNQFGGETCATQGFGSGALQCAADCSALVTSGCQPLPSCGDGVRNGGEQCDGNDLGGQTCMSAGFDLGVLSCTVNCTLNTSGCMDDNVNCGMMGDFCLFDENDLQSTCCPAGVGGNMLGICNVFVCV